MNLETKTETRTEHKASVETRHLNLALQGGGAHGNASAGLRT